MTEQDLAISSPLWRDRVGNLRDWVWHGWQTRYSYLRPQGQSLNQTETPFLLIHGFGASIGHWRNNIPELGKTASVYALDMLGFGDSEKAIASYGVALWVEQIFDFWQTFIGQPTILVGNSIGSLVCLAAAIQHPEMVAGLVTLNLPDPSVREEAIPAFIRPAIAAIEGVFASPLLLKPLFYFVRRPPVIRPWAKLAYANPDAVDDDLVDILSRPAYDRGADRVFCRLFKAMTSPHFGPSVKAALPQLSVPMLLIWGKQDRMVPPGLAPQFAQYNPKIKLVALDRAGHCPHDECPEQVNPLILQWVADWSEDRHKATAEVG